MTNPKVTIIIPTYNRAHLISATLDSIVAQSHKNWECLIIDDESTDNIEELINIYTIKDKRFSFYRRPLNTLKGANACRNFGLELAKGEFINWFDSDDIMHGDKLKTQLDQLRITNASFSVCQTMEFRDNLDSKIGLLSKKLKTDKPFEDFIKKKIIWLTQAPLFRSSFLLENNLRFNEKLQAAQEWEFFVRILALKPHYEIIEKPLVYFRRHSDSLSANKDSKVYWNYFIARREIFVKFNNQITDELKSYLIDYFELILKLMFKGKNRKMAFKVLYLIITLKDLSFEVKWRMTKKYINYLLVN